jgi:hypothetical protein
VSNDVPNLLTPQEGRRAGLVPTVDEYEYRVTAAVAREREQEAITVSLTVHAHHDAAIG